MGGNVRADWSPNLHLSGAYIAAHSGTLLWNSSSFLPLGCAPFVRRRCRHCNTATRCSSNHRQQLAAAAAVVVPTSFGVRLLKGQQSSWLFLLIARLGLFSRWQPPPKTCQRGFFLYSDMCPRSRGCPDACSHGPFCDPAAS